jgi:hypothetical protein
MGKSLSSQSQVVFPIRSLKAGLAGPAFFMHATGIGGIEYWMGSRNRSAGARPCARRGALVPTLSEPHVRDWRDIDVVRGTYAAMIILLFTYPANMPPRQSRGSAPQPGPAGLHATSNRAGNGIPKIAICYRYVIRQNLMSTNHGNYRIKAL